MIKAAILGGTGYGGMELLRYLAGHPEVEVTAVTSRSQKGPVANRWAHLAGVGQPRVGDPASISRSRAWQ